MVTIRHIGSWTKSPGTFGGNENYSTQSERYSLEFLRHYYALNPSDVRHLGQSNQCDGILSRDGEDFANVEVKLDMETFENDGNSKKSGWPQINEVMRDLSPIGLHSGLGQWILLVTPNAGRLRNFFGETRNHDILSEYIRKLRATNAPLPFPEEFSTQGVITGLFPFRDGPPDVAYLSAHVEPRGGFIVSPTRDLIADYMELRMAKLSEPIGGKKSFIEKWAKRVWDSGVSEIHVVNVYESPFEWVVKGIDHQLYDPLCRFPVRRLGMSGLPPLQWHFWLLLRNFTSGHFIRAFLHDANGWTVVEE